MRNQQVKNSWTSEVNSDEAHKLEFQNFSDSELYFFHNSKSARAKKSLPSPSKPTSAF